MMGPITGEGGAITITRDGWQRGFPWDVEHPPHGFMVAAALLGGFLVFRT